MHKLDPGTAILYWIPTISIFFLMTIFLSASFWRYRRKKEKGRQSQRDYLDLDFSINRPRIGALSCHTHANQWTELMQSFSATQIKNIMREYQMDLPHQFVTIEEESKSNSSEKDSYRLPSEHDEVVAGPLKGRRASRQDKFTLNADKPSQCQSINQSSLQVKDWGQDEVKTGNLYYEQIRSVPFDEKKKIEKKHKKHKKKRKFLSFATRRDENNDDILDELQIASNRSSSPVNCDSNQLTKNSPFTVEITSISKDMPKKFADFSQGVYPSFSLELLDNEQLDNKQYNETWKSQDERKAYDVQPKRVRTTGVQDLQNNSSEKSTERLVWVTADDVSQTPV